MKTLSRFYVFILVSNIFYQSIAVYGGASWWNIPIAIALFIVGLIVNWKDM